MNRLPASREDGNEAFRGEALSTALRVLLVEDSEADAVLLLDALKRGGFLPLHRRVDRASDFGAALRSQAWDVVISDFALPGFCGFDALRILQESQLDVPFILVSGAIGEEIAVQAMKAGAHDYLMKDSLRRLAPAVRRELQDAQVRAERRRAEESLRALEKAVETLPLGVTVSDTQGRILYTNPAEAELHSYTREELRGQAAQRLGAPELWKPLELDEMRSLGPWKRERVNVRKDGSRFPAYLISDVVKSASGDPLGVVTTCEDITERKQVEEQQRRLAEMKTRFMILASHEMRTPLTILQGYVPLLAAGALGSLQPKQKNALEACLVGLGRLTRMLSEVTRLLEAGEDRLTLEREPMDLRDLASEVMLELSPFAERRSVGLRLDAPPAPARLSADRQKLRSVLEELIGNAIRFTPDGGEIRLRLATEDVKVLLAITDTGIGIDASQIDHVFEAFHTAGDINKHSSGAFEFGARGVGLGLTIVRTYVEAHGGRAWAESGGLGKGSTFHVVLPLAPPPPAEAR